MQAYKIQWIGPPQFGGPEIIEEVEISLARGAVEHHARQLFSTTEKPGASGIRVLDDKGTVVFALVSKEEDAPKA